MAKLQRGQKHHSLRAPTRVRYSRVRRSPAVRSRGGSHVSPACPFLLEVVGSLPVPHLLHAHRPRRPMSPRHVPASVTELSRIGLFSELPGETLTKLADRMQRDEVAAGTVVVGEVALTMHVPRTATVTAMTPCLIASCDATTFDELVRPLFADDDDPAAA